MLSATQVLQSAVSLLVQRLISQLYEKSLAVGTNDSKVTSTLQWTFYQPPVNQLTSTTNNLPF